MRDLEKEIKKYHILSFTQVRAIEQNDPYRCLWDVCGKPCIEWVLDAVKRSKYIDKIVVTTEDKKIRKVVEGLGVIVIDRPLHTAHDFPRDYSQGRFKRNKPRSLRSGEPDFLTQAKDYALYWLEKKENYVPDIFINVLGNQPLVITDTIDHLIEAFFEDEEATQARTFYPILPWIWIYNPEIKRLFPLLYQYGIDRQKYPQLYRIGSLSLTGLPLKSNTGGPRMASIFIKPEEAIELHNEEDLFLARCFMERRLDDKKKRRID